MGDVCRGTWHHEEAFLEESEPEVVVVVEEDGVDFSFIEFDVRCEVLDTFGLFSFEIELEEAVTVGTYVSYVVDGSYVHDHSWVSGVGREAAVEEHVFVFVEVVEAFVYVEEDVSVGLFDEGVGWDDVVVFDIDRRDISSRDVAGVDTIFVRDEPEFVGGVDGYRRDEVDRSEVLEGGIGGCDVIFEDEESSS